jgi:hypothetical protein
MEPFVFAVVRKKDKKALLKVAKDLVRAGCLFVVHPSINPSINVVARGLPVTCVLFLSHAPAGGLQPHRGQRPPARGLRGA